MRISARTRSSRRRLKRHSQECCRLKNSDNRAIHPLELRWSQRLSWVIPTSGGWIIAEQADELETPVRVPATEASFSGQESIEIVDPVIF